VTRRLLAAVLLAAASVGAQTPAAAPPSPAPPGPNQLASAAETVGPTPGTSAKRSGETEAICASRSPAAVSQPAPAS